MPRKDYLNFAKVGLPVLAVVAWFCFLPSDCQKKPALAPSADPFSAIEPPPMGATTYNDELKKQLLILDELLDQKIDSQMLSKVTAALMSGNVDKLSKDATSYESHLTKVLLTLPELVHPRENLSANQKLWLEAKFLFLKRRFIEAATKMTEVLQHEPNLAEVRNWRARAIFFLGNPDLAIAELNTIIKAFPAASAEALDALYLIGAIVFESNDTAAHRLATGIGAWEQYLERASPDPTMKKEILDSLVELRQRKESTARPATDLDPFSPSETFTAEKNAVLIAFAKEELDLALNLADALLKKKYDRAIATLKARIFFKTGRTEEAANLFLAIVTKDASYAPGYHYQGMAFMMRGEPQHAIASWRKTVAIDPIYARTHNLSQRIATAEKMIGENN